MQLFLRSVVAGMVLMTCSLVTAWIPPDTGSRPPSRIEPAVWVPIPLDEGNLTVIGPFVEEAKPKQYTLSVYGEYSPPSWQPLEECSIDLWVKPTATGVWEVVDTYSFAAGASYSLVGSTMHRTHPMSAPPPYSVYLHVYNSFDFTLYEWWGAGEYDVEDWSTRSPRWNR